SVCLQELARSGDIPRLRFELGRALLAKHDAASARRELEHAVAAQYRAARIGLADLLLDGSAGTSDAARAVALYEESWNSGVTIAAFKLGSLYESGVPSSSHANGRQDRDPGRAWRWYQMGADAGEPNALA